jgi:hypothetical protein
MNTSQYIQATSRAYQLAPLCSPEAVIAWEELAKETKEHYDAISACVSILRTSNPEPYSSAYEMIRDIGSGLIKVSTANCEHPLWDEETNIQFRVVHDVIGHASTGAGFDFIGEYRAYEKHAEKTIHPLARLALFTEAVGQVCAALDLGGFIEQKCAILPSYLQWSYKEHH